MTDNTEKNVLMKCIKCHYEEEVPEWILEEMSEGKTSDYDMMCPKCNGTMYEKSKLDKKKN